MRSSELFEALKKARQKAEHEARNGSVKAAPNKAAAPPSTRQMPDFSSPEDEQPPSRFPPKQKAPPSPPPVKKLSENNNKSKQKPTKLNLNQGTLFYQNCLEKLTS